MSVNLVDFEEGIGEVEGKMDCVSGVSGEDEKVDIKMDEEVDGVGEKRVEVRGKMLGDVGGWEIGEVGGDGEGGYRVD